jgi:hypothetical protein
LKNEVGKDTFGDEGSEFEGVNNGRGELRVDDGEDRVMDWYVFGKKRLVKSPLV